MTRSFEPLAAAMLRRMVHALSHLAPRPDQPAWRAGWLEQLRGWRELVERGELTEYSWREMSRSLRESASQALWKRFDRNHLRRLLLGPLAPLLAGFGLIAALAAVSHGFAATRAVAGAIRLVLFPPAGWPASALPRHGEDTVFAFSVPLVFAAGIAALLIASHPPRLRSGRWAYWGFLASKLLLALPLVTLAWIELSAMVRACLPASDGRALLTGLTFRIIFLAAFAGTARWCFRDQERRCPECLQLLTAPVSIGNCSQVFEPAVTEFVCARGHGVLSVPEVDAQQAGGWTPLDASWRELFADAPAR